MNRREFMKFLGGAAAAVAIAPKALAEAGDPGPWGFQGSVIGPNLAPGFIVLEPGMSVQEAISALSAQGGTVYVREGTYIADQTITIPADVTLVAQGSLTISGCEIRGAARPKGDAPIWMLMEEDDQVEIIGNSFDCERVGSMDSWFYVPIGEELERVKRSLFDLYLKFKKLVV